MTPRELNHFLDLFLDSKGLKRKDAIEYIGCTPSEWSQMISGSRRHEAYRDKLAALVGLPKDKLFGPDHEAAQLAKNLA